MKNQRTHKSFSLIRGYLLLVFCLVGVAPCSLLQAEVRLYGTTYVDLKNVAAKWGMKQQWLKAREEVLLTSKWTRLRFKIHQRHCFVNDRKVYLGNAIVFNRGGLYISDRDYQSTLKPILLPQTFPNPPKLYRIVIDPGHGGKDPGAVNKKYGVNEKKAALSVAKMLKKKLEPLGYKVVLTRDSDRFVSLSERPRLANKIRADLFISLHFNAVGTSKVSGVETFVFTHPGQPSSNRTKLVSSDKKVYSGNKKNTWSTLAGYYVQSSMTKNLRAKDRGLKRARFAVLRDLKCPGMLVEGGFLTNPTEARKIKTRAYQEKLADSIVEGILTYQKTLNRIRAKNVAQSESR